MEVSDDANEAGRTKKRKLLKECLTAKGEEELKTLTHPILVGNPGRNQESSWNENERLRRRMHAKMRELSLKEKELKTAREEVSEREKKLAAVVDTLEGRITTVEEREKALDLLLRRNIDKLRGKEEDLRKKGEQFALEVKTAEMKMMKQFEKEKEDFGLFLEENMRELGSKEEMFCKKWEYIYRKSEQLRMTLEKKKKSNQGCIKRLQIAESDLEVMKLNVDKRLMKMESWHTMGSVSCDGILKEAVLIKESAEKKIEEFGKVKEEFDSYQEKKMAEMELKKHEFETMYLEFQDKLNKREYFVVGLIERLDCELVRAKGTLRSAEDIHEKNGLRKTELNSLRDWIEKKMEEVDSKQVELMEKEKLTMAKQEAIKVKEQELTVKELALLSQQMELEARQREVDLAFQQNEQMSAAIEWREKNLDSVKEFTRRCFFEHRAIKRELLSERKALEKLAADLHHKEKKLTGLEKQVDAADTKFEVIMDGKTLHDPTE